MSINPSNPEQTRKLLRGLKPEELEEQAATATMLAGLARRQQGADAASRQRQEADRYRHEIDDNQAEIESLEQQLAQNRDRRQEIEQELSQLRSESHDQR